MASVEGMFGAAPAGIDLAESQVRANTGAISAMLALAIISVGLRLYARVMVKKIGLGGG